jgi:hypothetical protein
LRDDTNGGREVGRFTHRLLHVDGLARQVWNSAVSATVCTCTSELNAGESNRSAVAVTPDGINRVIIISFFKKKFCVVFIIN